MKITEFNFKSGKSLAGKYTINQKIGEGYESEVYTIKEVGTKIERVAKFFFPHLNEREQASKYAALKLHKLQDCPSVVQYHFHGTITVKGQQVHYIVSQFLEGEPISEYIARKKGKKVEPYEALNILYAIVNAVLCVHQKNENHGDIHEDNIFIQRKGVQFDIKLIDLFHSGPQGKGKLKKDDVVDICAVLYELVGGKKYYAKSSPEIKYICCGLKRSLILKKFPTLQKLKDHLDSFTWN